MVKITDVAKEAGVSPSTVSHVLNGNRPISKRTKERVLDTIAKLGYIPNSSARTLKSSRSGIIGFYASDITESFVNRVIRGVEKELNAKGETLLFCSGSEFDHDLFTALRFLIQKGIDGLIVCYETTQKDTIPDLPDDIKVPLVFINRDLSPLYPSIIPDDVTAGKHAADHLFEQGVRAPIIIAGPEGRPASIHRVEGFFDQWQVLTLQSRNEISLFYGDFSFESGVAGVKAIFDPEKTDGIFCCNDYIAAGAIEELRRQFIDVPEKVKVLGFDNREFSKFWPVPISTFEPPLEEMGEMSACSILDVLNKAPKQEKRQFCHSSLIKRESTG